MGWYEGRNPPYKNIWDFWIGLFGWIIGKRKDRKEQKK